MSFEYYANWWLLTKKQLLDLRRGDDELRKKYKIIRSRTVVSKLLGGLYAKYAMVIQEIDTCLDQMAQPQKRITVRKLMDAATMRLSELNEELRKIDISEFHYVDGTLTELKLIPHDVEIIHPALFYPRPFDIEDLLERWKKPRIHSADLIIDHPDAEVKQPQKPHVKIISPQVSIKPDTLTEQISDLLTKEADLKSQLEHRKAVELIQTAERARQSRLYTTEKTNERKLQLFQMEAAKKKDASDKPRRRLRATSIEAAAAATTTTNEPAVVQIEAPTKTEPNTNRAAMTIQRTWRQYVKRKMALNEEKKRRLLIGMSEPVWRSKEQFDLLEANLEKRRIYRDQRIREYVEAIDNEKVRILRVVGPGLFEDIGDEIREWFRVWYQEARNFDKYPDIDKGGSILVVRGETMTPKEWIDEVERRRRERTRAGRGADQLKEKAKKEKELAVKLAAEKKKREADQKKKKANEAKKRFKKRFKDFEYEMKDTGTLALHNEGRLEHIKIWDKRKDADNPLEKHYMDIISEQKHYEVQLEVRKNVDVLMRLELELLEAALESDRIRRGGKKGKKKKKKKKKKRKHKKRQRKDMTKDRTISDLFNELVDNGIIHTYPFVPLSSFHGDFSYKNYEMRRLDLDPPATLLDVRQAVILNAILPLGVEKLKKPRSVLIAGARQSGKHLLANAIFTETKCVLFDLSPEITVGKYPGKSGMKMLLHLINKMSRILQPSVIYFNGAERLFYTKVPKDERHLDPKRIGKKLFKGIVKTIKPEDRVLVLGVSGKPWAASAVKMRKAFEIAILIPRPDYGSIYMYWRELLMAYYGVDRDFNFTCLAKVTINYPFTDIKRVVEMVLTPRRIIQLTNKPLRPQELYEAFIAHHMEPITDKQYNKFIKWYGKTPVGKERKLFNKFAELQREALAKQAKKAAAAAIRK